MRIAWTGPVGTGGGVPGMGTLMLTELVRQGVEVDVYLTADETPLPSLESTPGLRMIVRRSGWRWGRWYSSTKATALFSGLAVRTLGTVLLNVRLVIEHRRRPYDAIYQLSQTELFLLGRLRHFLPPIVVHPCVHAAGELRWHRRESRYALRAERHSVHLLMRALLTLRTWLQPKELARADLVLGLSERFNTLLREDYGVPAEKLGVVRTPVDLERFAATGPEAKDTPRTILFISRISVRKGVEEIIELSHRLADLAGSVRLMVIGGATLWSDYTAHLKGLNPAVATYVGGIPSEQLPALLRSATLLVVPSRYEPGSIAAVEALACGLPVVLSDAIGAGEAVSGPHVRVHTAGDVDGLEAAVRALLDASAQDEAGLRMAARANAEARFAPEAVVAELIVRLAAVSGRDAGRGPAATEPAAAPAGGVSPSYAPSLARG